MMKDRDKTRRQLIKELVQLREVLAEIRGVPVDSLQLGDYEELPDQTRNSRDATQTIDLKGLFTDDITTSGSFDIRGDIWATTFGKLLQALPIPAFLIDESQRISVANQACARINPTYVSVVGSPFSNLFPDRSEAVAADALLGAVFEDRKPRIHEYKIEIGKNVVWGRMTFRSMRIMNERYILVLMEDLTRERKQNHLSQARRQRLTKEIALRKKAENELREREEVLRNVLNASPVGIGYVEGRTMLWANRRMVEMFGLEDDTDYGGGSTRVLYASEEEYTRVGKTLYEGLSSESHASTDALFKKRDGSVFHGHIGISALDATNPMKGAVATILDISERKRAEHALKNSEKRFRAIYDNVPIMINAFSPEGKILLWNREIEKRLGWSLEEAQTVDVLALCYPDPQAYRVVKESIDAADGQFREFTPLDKNGSQHTQLWANFRLPDGSVISVGHDVTELRRSERKLEVQQRRFETLARYAPFGLVMASEDGTYLYVNPKFKELFGYDLSEIGNGREFCRLAFPDPAYRHEVISLWKHDLEKAEVGELRPRICRVKCKDGTHKEILFRPVQLESGEHFITCGDVTEQKRAEEEIRSALELSVRLRQEAEAANTAKSRFLSNMSHEIRTPLNAVIGFSQILEDQSYGELNDQQIKFVRYIAESGAHLLHLINEILDLAKVEAGKMALQDDYVDVERLLRSSLEMIDQTARRKGIRIDIDFDKGLSGMKIKADEVKLRQIIFNLLSNSAKFTPDGGTITLKAVVQGKSLLVGISDSGAGFRPEDKERIFEAFEQGDNSLIRKHGGTGLGLALTRKLVELHGGTIRAESEGLNKGSTFSFTIPMVEQD
ncbi:MAG: PAS domain S-box protein [Desulfomonilaceae bacterium]|nr:PAS domain S-box protein [Desulfomonilaceae bacterium]